MPMDTKLHDAVDAITKKAGWPRTDAGSDGAYHFSLEGGLDFSLSTPDGRTAFFLAKLCRVPDLGSPEAEAELERVAKLSAGALKKRRSVLSVSDQNFFELSRSFSLTECSERDILSHAKDFLNDLSWWKKQLDGERQAARNSGAPRFGFDMSNWFLR